MKKLITLILALIMVICVSACAFAEVTPDPSVGISLDIPDDWGTRNVAIQPFDLGGGIVGLVIQYMDYDQLTPYLNAVKEAAMNNDENAMNEAYAAYQEASGKYSVDCGVIIGVPSDTPEETLAQFTENMENVEKLGSNSTHTYYKAVGLETEGRSEEVKAAAEAEFGYICDVLNTAAVIEIEEESNDVSDEAVSALAGFSSVDMDGNPVDAGLFAKADLTVLNIWGTYCNPCIAEMPELAAWSKELPENVQLVGLIVDVNSADDKNFAKAQKILSKTNADFVNILYNDTLADLVSDISGTPTTLFLDSNGNQVAEAVVGADMAAYKSTVESIINQ